MIVALVGIDGAGKTTQAKSLARWLTSRGMPATYFENPGWRPALNGLARRLGYADGIDLLGRTTYLAIEATVRWIAIARALVWSRLTRRTAVMDRYSYCQYAMMHVRGDRGQRLARAWYSRFPRPDLVCFLAVSPERAQQRVRARGTDDEELPYLRALDHAYRALPEMAKFTIVDANGEVSAVRAALCDAITQSPNLAGNNAGNNAAAD